MSGVNWSAAVTRGPYHGAALGRQANDRLPQSGLRAADGISPIERSTGCPALSGSRIVPDWLAVDPKWGDRAFSNVAAFAADTSCRS